MREDEQVQKQTDQLGVFTIIQVREDSGLNWKVLNWLWEIRERKELR